jgi:hypothetical protein
MSAMGNAILINDLNDADLFLSASPLSRRQMAAI